MNFLFYVGIIVPTVITIALFVIFIYCWFLQKARKEVLTKKYDPHGKMRSLGMSMKFPPPPTFCLLEDVQFLKIGEDNVAYDVSRSPSTEQDGRGRPLYHTYHDSGISAGLSPTLENGPRHSLTYRTCPDSGTSGLVLHAPQSGHLGTRGSSQIVEQQQQRRPQLQQVCGDQIHIHAHQQQQCHQQNDQQQYHQQNDQQQYHQQNDQQQYHQQNDQQQYHQQDDQHYNIIHSPTHSSRKVRSSEEMAASTNPLQYNPLHVNKPSPSHVDYHNRQIGLSPHEHLSSTPPQQPPQTTIISLYHDISEEPISPTKDQIFYHPNQTTQIFRGYQMHNHLGRRDRVVPLSPNHELSSRSAPLSPSSNSPLQPPRFPDINGHKEDLILLSSPVKPLRHSYRDSGVVDIGQSIPAITERPDSQASHSSTTDSEDSGFRSSYCAAHNKAVLNKQGNPLLKPLRKSRISKSSSKPSKKNAHSTDHHPSNNLPQFITLSPKNLERNVSNSVGTRNSSRPCPQAPQRSYVIPQQQHSTTNCVSNERVLASFPEASQAGAALTFNENSPTKHRQQTSPLDVWPTQSSNDQDSVVKQCIDLNDISTHLSWKYMQNASFSKKPSTGLTSDGIMLESCVPGVRSGPSHQISRDQPMEQYGYSVV